MFELAWNSQITRVFTPRAFRRLARFRSVKYAAATIMFDAKTLALEAGGRQDAPFLGGFLFVGHGGDARLIHKTLNLRLDTCAGVKSHAAQRTPLRLCEIDRQKPAGILVHCTSR